MKIRVQGQEFTGIRQLHDSDFMGVMQAGADVVGPPWTDLSSVGRHGVILMLPGSCFCSIWRY